MTTFLGVLPILDGVPTTFTNQGGGLRGIIIGNESGLTVIIAMDGTSHSKSLYPGTVDFFPIDGAFSGTVKVQPTARLSNTSQWPSSFLQFDSVGVNEQVNTGVYPLTLPRLTNVGNSIPVSTSTSGVTNEGNAINTEVIDIGPVGNIKMMDVFNDHFIWSVVQSGVAHQVLKGNTAGNPLQIGQVGDVTEILGSLTVDNFIKATDIESTSINNLALGVATGNAIKMKVNNSDVLDIAGSFVRSFVGMQIDGIQTVVNGGVSGTATLYEILTGTIKLSIIQFNNFKTGAAAQPITFSTPYTSIAKVWTGGISAGSQFRSGVTVRDLDVITALAAGGGTTANQNSISSDTFGTINEGFDNLLIPANNVSAHTSLAILIGL